MRTFIASLLFPLILISACSPAGQESADEEGNCPVTQPQETAFTPPETYAGLEAPDGFFWHGSDGLWTMLPDDGIWWGLPEDKDGYIQKIFWWADGYVWTEEPEPVFLLSGERLDGEAPRIESSEATNAYSEYDSSILTGVAIPTLGCWEFTGLYKGTELSFVVLVRP